MKRIGYINTPVKKMAFLPINWNVIMKISNHCIIGHSQRDWWKICRQRTKMPNWIFPAFFCPKYRFRLYARGLDWMVCVCVCIFVLVCVSIRNEGKGGRERARSRMSVVDLFCTHTALSVIKFQYRRMREGAHKKCTVNARLWWWWWYVVWRVYERLESTAM